MRKENFKRKKLKNDKIELSKEEREKIVYKINKELGFKLHDGMKFSELVDPGYLFDEDFFKVYFVTQWFEGETFGE